MMLPVTADMPPPDVGFNRLVAIVTRDGVLDPNVMVCEPHALQADHPGCKWAPAPRRSWLGTARAWLGAQWNFVLEALADGD